MTEILERRWKCDFCGRVSSALTYKNDPGAWRNLLTVIPLGWIKDVDRHFCCGMHDVCYHNKRADSAKTLEVTI